MDKFISNKKTKIKKGIYLVNIYISYYLFLGRHLKPLSLLDAEAFGSDSECSDLPATIPVSKQFSAKKKSRSINN